MLHFLDIFYTLLHIAIMGFNLTGWIWKRTRIAHVVLLCLTAGSWVVLGPWYGWGYCPITDWHWRVKLKLGETDLPNSFVKYLADKISGKDIPSSIIDGVTLGCLVFSIVAAFYVNLIIPNRKANAS